MPTTTSPRLRVPAAAVVLGLLLACVGLAVAPQPARAASFTVSTTEDVLDAAATCGAVRADNLPGPDGLVSLREAVCAANSNPGADTLVVPSGVYVLTREGREDNGTNGDLDVVGELTIEREGTEPLVFDGGLVDRVFHLRATGATLRLADATLRNGRPYDDGGALLIASSTRAELRNVTIVDNAAYGGGGIANHGTLVLTDSLIAGNTSLPGGVSGGGGISSEGLLTVQRSIIEDNTATSGGGIAIYGLWLGSPLIEQSLIRANTATGGGGGIYVVNAEGVRVNDSTIASNSAYRGGGVDVSIPDSRVQLRHVTITGNTAELGGGVSTATSSYVSGINSIIEDGTRGNVSMSATVTGDAGLVPVTDDTGRIFMYSLRADSPAIDSGSPGSCTAVDQRGVGRPAGSNCDAGAVEVLPPDTVITFGPPAATPSTASLITFDGVATGALVTRFECSFNGTAFASCSSPLLVDFPEGERTFSVRSVDAGGIVDDTPATVTWWVDQTAPGTSIDAQPAPFSSDRSPTFEFSGTDSGSGVARFECRLDGGPFANCASPHQLSELGEGAHTFEVRAVDAAANIDATPASSSWTVDTTAPETEITDLPYSITGSTSADFELSGDDGAGSGVAGFECSLDDAAYEACDDAFTLSGLSDGLHTLRVRAVDRAGNADPTPYAWTWRVDTVAPETTVSSRPPAVTSDPDATIGFAAQDPAGSGVTRIECSLDGSPFDWCESPLELAGLADGAHTLQLRAVDAAENVEAAPQTVEWLVDTTAPQTILNQAPAGSTTSTGASIVFSGTDAGSGIVGFECSVDGGAFAACTSALTLSGLALGAHSFAVRALDAAGNADATPATASWTVVAPPAPAQAAPPSRGGAPAASEAPDVGPEVDEPPVEPADEPSDEPVGDETPAAETPADPIADESVDLTWLFIVLGVVALLVIGGVAWLLLRRRP